MQNFLFILNDPPYGTERSYNGVRLARGMLEAGNCAVRVFLIGDGAACGKADQKVPQGYYNLGDMLGGVIRRGGEVAVCGTCIDARGIADSDLVQGAQRGNMAQLVEWTQWADKVVSF